MSPGLGTLDRFRRAAAALLKLDAIRAGGVTEARYASESDLRDIVEWAEAHSPVGDALRRAVPSRTEVEIA